MKNGIDVIRIDDPRGREARDFLALPHRIYAGNPHWVPWLAGDVRIS